MADSLAWVPAASNTGCSLLVGRAVLFHAPFLGGARQHVQQGRLLQLARGLCMRVCQQVSKTMPLQCRPCMCACFAYAQPARLTR